MIISRYRSQSAVLFIPVFLLGYASVYSSVYPLLVICLMVMLKTNRLMGMTALIFSLLFFLRIQLPVSSLAEGYIETQAVVVKQEAHRTHPRLLVKTNDQHRLFVYDGDVSRFQAGDQVLIKGEVSLPSSSGFFQGFDYQAYLNSIRVDGLMYEAIINPQPPSFNRHILSGWFHQSIDARFEQTAPYLKAFILADRHALDEGVYEQVKTVGVAHLFAVSGMHVALMIVGLNAVLSVLSRGWFKHLLLVVILAMYLLITGSPPSVLRAVMMVMLVMVNRAFKWQFDTVDLLVFLFAGLLLYHPDHMHHVGFVLSFTISYGLLMSQHHFDQTKPLKTSILVSCISFFIGFPFITDINQAINVLAVFHNVIFVFLLTTCILPLAYLTFMFEIFEVWFQGALLVFERLIAFGAENVSLMIPIHIKPGVVTVIYFVVLLSVLCAEKTVVKVKRACMLCCLLMVIMLEPYLTPYASFTMFDVQGDAFLFQDRHNRCNMLIDTGDADDHGSVVRALKSRHITTLDVVFITHRHADHYRAYDQIADQIKVKRLITNDNQHTQGEGQWQTCGAIAYYIFPFDDGYTSENNRSLMKKVVFEGVRFLFTGDAEREREVDFIGMYAPEIDWLKAAHHGSNTSSTDAFIDHLSPSRVFIPAHRNNRYGFPSKQVIERYQARDIQITSTHEKGTVVEYFIFNRRIKKTALSP